MQPGCGSQSFLPFSSSGDEIRKNIVCTHTILGNILASPERSTGAAAAIPGPFFGRRSNRFGDFRVYLSV
jgi:hypothetical protein